MPDKTPSPAHWARARYRQRLGCAAEDQAARALVMQGLHLLARNLRCRAGEIDLVARDGPTLVFIEVRFRRSRRFGGAIASVGRHKRLRLIRAARYFLPELCRHHFGGQLPPCRFDVVGFEGGRLCWIRHAFSLGDA